MFMSEDDRLDLARSRRRRWLEFVVVVAIDSLFICAGKRYFLSWSVGSCFSGKLNLVLFGDEECLGSVESSPGSVMASMLGIDILESAPPDPKATPVVDTNGDDVRQFLKCLCSKRAFV